MTTEEGAQQNLEEIPLTFWIGVHHYRIDDPLASWRVVDGQPVCVACGKALHLDDWASPPRSAVASCNCVRAEDGREVVQRASHEVS
jgi:hypothetical protein